MKTLKTNLAPIQLEIYEISEVFDLYYPQLFRFVRYRLGDETQAEDISNEVFTRLLEAIQSRRGPTKNLSGWLFSTASHIITDHIRAQYRATQTVLNESIQDDAATPAERLEAYEEVQVLLEGMKQLTVEQQNVLALRFGAGYSLEETAGVMKKRSNTVKQLQFRALNSLRRTLGMSE